MSGQIFDPDIFRIQASGLFSDPPNAYTQTTPHFTLLRPLAESHPVSGTVARLNLKNVDLNIFCQGPEYPELFSPWIVTYNLR